MVFALDTFWWISSSLCPIRVVADLSLALSIPVLFYKIRKTGHEHVSIATQILNLLAFCARYADLLTPYHHPSLYATALKLFLIYGTLALALYLLYAHRAARCTSARCAAGSLGAVAVDVAVQALACASLARVYSYDVRSKIEFGYAFSMYVAVLAPVTQFAALLRAPRVERLLVLYLALVFAFRALYIPHWILRWNHERMFDPIAAIPAGVQLVVFLVLGGGVFFKHRRNRGAVQLEDDATLEPTVLYDEKVDLAAPPAPKLAVITEEDLV